MRDRSGSEAVTSKASLGSDDKMRGEAQRLQTFFLQLSTRLYIVHQSPYYPDVGVGLPLRYPQRSDAGCSIWMSPLGDISTETSCDLDQTLQIDGVSVKFSLVPNKIQVSTHTFHTILASHWGSWDTMVIFWALGSFIVGETSLLKSRTSFQR